MKQEKTISVMVRFVSMAQQQDGNDPPPKPPSLKPLGKRRSDPIFDEDNEYGENSGSEGVLLVLDPSNIAGSNLNGR